MKILLNSHLYSPSVGGIETVSQLLAASFHEAGHQVKVATQTVARAKTGAEKVAVIRRPSLAQMLELVRWCDVVFHNNISLRAAWPLLLHKKPWVIAHHIWISRTDGSLGIQDRLKLQLLAHATNIAISHAIAVALPVSSTIIPDPYDASVFRWQPGVTRDHDLVFVGRLVSDKGVDLLLNAIAILGKQGFIPRLTIVGVGPEENALREQALHLGISKQIEFAGMKQENALATLLNQHRILVVPSRWHEPFGIVALEGIACGCVVVGSEGGGLKDAIGPCGQTFPNGDCGALANILECFLRNRDLETQYLAHAPSHLNRHHPRVISEAYLQVFEQALLKF